MKQLHLVNTKSCAQVDDEDYDLCARHTWYLFKYPRTSYAKAIVDGNWVGLHQFIYPAPLNMQVDHKDGDGLNNQRSNLRHATLNQQRMNMRHHANSTSRYKGVSKNTRGTWTAQIKINGKQTSLGRFEEEIWAAQAYNRAAKQHYGEFAKLNIFEEGTSSGLLN